MELDLENARFLDFEASSLHRMSWPIEIGIARIQGDDVIAESRLIRPAPGWSLDFWSEDSQKIHNVSLDRLYREGEAVEDVADWFRSLGCDLLISDSPAYEQMWLIRLLDAAPPFLPIRIMGLDVYLRRRLEGESTVDQVYEHLARSKIPHRAGEDAARLARAFLMGRDIEAGRAPPVMGGARP